MVATQVIINRFKLLNIQQKNFIQNILSTKCLLHSAELVEQIKTQGKDIGVEVEGVKVNFPQVIAHKNAISKMHTVTDSVDIC